AAPRRLGATTFLGILSTSPKERSGTGTSQGHDPSQSPPGSYQSMPRGGPGRKPSPARPFLSAPAIPIMAGAGFQTAGQGMVDHCRKRLSVEEAFTARERRSQCPEDAPPPAGRHRAAA